MGDEKKKKKEKDKKEKKEKKEKKKKSSKSKEKSSSKRDVVADENTKQLEKGLKQLQEESSSSSSEEDNDPNELKPIPPPNNPPMETITLLLNQPNLQKLEWRKVDPANTNLRMVREYLTKHYYKGNEIPRSEQRPLLYRMKPIFEPTGDPNVDDAKTLADYGLTKDRVQIDLDKMHVHVVSPSTKKSMVINNVDPMNDAIFEMRKLALEDGYPIEKLRVLHKENNNAEIKKSHNDVTFFFCGVKHNHTLILEWPKIVIKLKLPASGSESDAENTSGQTADKFTMIEEHGRKYKLIDFETQAELDPVQKIHDFVTKHTTIPQDKQSLFSTSKKGKQRNLKDPKKVVADYKLQEGDVIELEPMKLRVNYVNGGQHVMGKQAVFDKLYPSDRIEHVKDLIAAGQGEADGVPAIPKTQQSLRKFNDRQELNRDRKRLMDEGLTDGDGLDVEKTKINIRIQLPTSPSGETNGKGGKIIDVGVNLKTDDVDTIRDMLADQTGLPKEYIPHLSYKGQALDDPSKKLTGLSLAEDDILNVDPIQLNVKVLKTGETVGLDNVDPFTDTLNDIKERLGPSGKDILPVDQQRFLFMGADLNDGDILNNGNRDDGVMDDRPRDPGDRRLFECKIHDKDTIQLEKAKIDVKIKRPDGKTMIMKGADPRNKKSLTMIGSYLSNAYYKGKDKDGTIPSDQLLPLAYEGEPVTDGKSLRDLGIMDDGEVIAMKPMTVHVVISPDEKGNGKTKTLADVDPMNDDIYKVKSMGAKNGARLHDLVLQHKEGKMKEIDQTMEHKSYFDYGVHDGHTLVIQRKPVSIQIKLPKGAKINRDNIDEDDPTVKIVQGSGKKDPPVLVVRLNPDHADFDAIRNRISDIVGIPVACQKLNKTNDDGDSSGERLVDAPGDTKLSDPQLDLASDSILELEPMTIHIQTETNGTIPLQVLPTDTVEEVKKKLTKQHKLGIPSDIQRFIGDDDVEIGGDAENENSTGSDKSPLLDLNVKDGDTLSLEKSKIALSVKMPHGMDDVKLLVDPRYDTVNRVRQFIFDESGLPKEFQQRLKFNGDLMDDGYVAGSDHEDEDDDGGDENKTTSNNNNKKKKLLSNFDLKEFGTIEVEPTRVYIMKMPEQQTFVVEDMDPMKNILQDLKKKIATEISIPPFKQRLMNSESGQEYIGNKDTKTTLFEYGIQDGHVIHLEQCKINLRIILPHLDELDLTVDPRKDDLQKVRDHVFKRYYKNRDVPEKFLRPMMLGPRRNLDKEPGETKLMDLGIVKDDDHVKLQPVSLSIETPKRKIYCPNADPFHDTLDIITKFIEHEGISTAGLHIQYKGKKMKDYKSVLYDLDIGSGDTLHFVE